MATAQELFQRHTQLKDRRRYYESTLREIADYILPLKRGISSETIGGVGEGNKQTELVFDSTAIFANELLAARLVGNLASPGVRWFGYTVRDSAVNEAIDVRRWLEDAATRTYLALTQSNFHAVLHEVMMDLPALGTAGMYVEELAPQTPEFNGLNFKACSIGEIAIDENAQGIVDTVYRTFSLTARAALSRFGTKLHEKTQELAAKKPYHIVDFLHCTYPRETGKPLNGGPRLATDMPFASVYLEVQKKHKVEESGYPENPYAVGRWAKTPGEIYGRGPGHTAIPDVKTLNRAVDMYYKQWALAIQPPTMEQYGNVVGSVKWIPGGRIVVRNFEKFREFITQARFDVTTSGLDRLTKKVNDIFFVDQLALKESPEMTATEVIARLELMQQLMGPALGRIMQEVLNTALQRIFGIMVRARAYDPDVPAALSNYVRQYGHWDVEYQSPLARAQRLPDLAAIQRTLQIAAPMQAVQPQVLDVLDLDMAVRHAAEVTGVPASMVRSEEEVALIRKQRAQQEAMIQQAQTALTVAEAAGKAAPMVKALQPQGAGA